MEKVNANFLPGNPTTPIQEIISPFLHARQIGVYVKREDLSSPSMHGNKWHKLKYHLVKARELRCHTIVSLGGAYSNHLHALANACERFGFKGRFYLRGEEPPVENPTVREILSKGMDIEWVPREKFKALRNPDAFGAYASLPGIYAIPEGGGGSEGLKGCAEWMSEMEDQLPFVPDVIAVPAGTGTTAAGLINGCRLQSRFEVYAAVEDKSLPGAIRLQLNEGKNPPGTFELIPNYTFGGFARWNEDLVDFIRKFESDFSIPLDPVYTAKMFLGLFRRIEDGLYPPGTQILAIHTGGLQGRKGFEERFGITL